jgi:hypothetical protein
MSLCRGDNQEVKIGWGHLNFFKNYSELPDSVNSELFKQPLEERYVKLLLENLYAQNI